MCGIFGYKGTEDSFSIVFTGLKDLEYRGYDSWGIASLTNESITVVKRVGKIGEELTLTQKKVIFLLDIQDGVHMAVHHKKMHTPI